MLVGTAALDDTFLGTAVERFGGAVVVAVDVREGRVTVNGWTQDSGLRAMEFAQRCAAAGIERLLVTSTSRDGTLAGPDVELLEEVLAVGLPVVAAGGIATLDDLRALRRLGCEGAVTGSAIWLGRFSLAEALSLEAWPSSSAATSPMTSSAGPASPVVAEREVRERRPHDLLVRERSA